MLRTRTPQHEDGDIEYNDIMKREETSDAPHHADALTDELVRDDPVTRISRVARLEPASETPDEEHRSRARIEGVVIGEVIGLDVRGRPLVRFDMGRGHEGLVAGSLVAVSASLVGKRVALQFMEGDLSRPMIIGPIVHGLSEAVQDGEVALAAERRLVLRCGAASITLTREGKVIIRGSYVSNRSSGMLRLRGGTVSIN